MAFAAPRLDCPMTSLRQQALQAWLCADPEGKALAARAISLTAAAGADDEFNVHDQLPGRPERPILVTQSQLKQRSMATVEGRATLIHALAHIELNAIDLALDVVWRFSGMPDDFYRQWVGVAQEEALHFTLLRDHLRGMGGMGYEYGDFPAHDALWQMAAKTKGDVLARVALVPRTLETRGLDASPLVKAKLVGAGDLRAGEIIDIILRDEVGHVALGNQWYRWLCEQRGFEPVATYALLAQSYGAPRLRGPFNLEARRAAGFTEEELALLTIPKIAGFA